MAATAVADIAAVCRRPLVAAELPASQVAADAARAPGLALHGGREVDRSLFAAGF